MGDQQFWLTQIQDIDLRSIDEALRQAGAKLVGIAHPAVASVDEVKSPTDPWRSLQNWDETTLLMRGSGEAIADFHTMSSGMQSQRTVQEFENFFEGVDGDATLQWIGDLPLPQTVADLPQTNNHRQIDTSQEASLKNWAAAWMRSNSKPAIGSPLITIPKRPMSKEMGIAIAAVLGLLMIALCGGHYWFMSQQLADVNANIERMQAQQKEVKDDEKKIEQLNKDKDKIAKENEKLLEEVGKAKSEVANAKRIIDRSDSRWLSLVDSLSDVSDPNGPIREISSTDSTVTINGFAVSDSVVHRLAARLESTPLAQSWEILPASTKIDPKTALIDYTIELVALGSKNKASATGSATASSRTSRRRRRGSN